MSTEIVETNAYDLTTRALPGQSDGGRDNPGRDIRAGAIIAGLFFILFLGWAAFARLDHSARSEDGQADDRA